MANRVYPTHRRKRTYRRKRTLAGSLLSDTTAAANRLSWQGTALLGVALFAVFYWALPDWIAQYLESLRGNKFYPIVNAALGRRIHWVQWLGIALGMLCTFFAVRKLFTAQQLDRGGQYRATWFSRFLARLLD